MKHNHRGYSTQRKGQAPNGVQAERTLLGASTNRGTSAQVSIEMLAGIGVVLILFLVIVFYNQSITDTRDHIAAAYLERNTCLTLASTISNTYAAGDGTQSSFTFDENAQIVASQKRVLVGEQNCGFLARLATDYNLQAGTITITNTQGVISVVQTA